MEIMTPELLDKTRESEGLGSLVVLATSQGETTYPWNDTDADWEQILLQIAASLSDGVRVQYCGVITSGITVDPATYVTSEYSTMVVVTQAGFEAYEIPFGGGQATYVPNATPNDLEFDLEQLRSVLWPTV